MRLMILAAALAGSVTVASAADAQTVYAPGDQVAAMRAVDEAREAYKTCPNQLKCSSIRIARDKAVSAATDRGRLINWVGVLDTLATTGDGDAYIAITVPEREVTLSTWNNSISDMTDKTLIKHGSPLYETLAEMEVGDVVIFSGQIKSEKSLTEAGSIAAPDFAVRFSAIRLATIDDTDSAD
jgi:hypothetical protein